MDIRQSQHRKTIQNRKDRETAMLRLKPIMTTDAEKKQLTKRATDGTQ